MRKLASIQQITNVRPIPGADNIVAVNILGWECVALKNEFVIGDNCVYFEIDSLLPVAPWTDFLRKGDERKFRLKTVTLRGQISQGLALPFVKTPLADAPALEIGTDVTELLGIEKWEPQVSQQLAGDAKGNFPAFLKKTDEPRIQAEPAVIEEVIKKRLRLKGRAKIDGTSFTAYIRYTEHVDGYEKGVCSRNLELKENADNAYWKMANKMDLFTTLHNIAGCLKGLGMKHIDNIAVQAELAGPGIQGNKMGYKEVKLIVFNLVVNGQYMDDEHLESAAATFGLELAPVVFDGYIDEGWDVRAFLDFVNNLNYDNGTPMEGAVFRPVVETYSEVLKGRMSFKAISNRFLLKYKE